jgi:hypothetical protein
MTIRKKKFEATMNSQGRFDLPSQKKVKLSATRGESPLDKAKDKVSQDNNRGYAPMGGKGFNLAMVKPVSLPNHNKVPDKTLPVQMRAADDPSSDRIYGELFASSNDIPERTLACIYFEGDGFNVEMDEFSPMGKKGFPSVDDVDRSIKKAKIWLEQYRNIRS